MSDYQISILNTLTDTMDETLGTDLIDLIPDDTKTGLVRFGNLQDDPTVAQLNVLIHRGDENWRDELKLDDIGIYTPTYEIGSSGGGTSQWWWRRYIIELTFFFDNEPEREVARKKANTVLPRVQRSLWDMEIPTDMDDFGESAHSLQIRDCYLEESGGEGEFIWRGEVRVEFVTSIRG